MKILVLPGGGAAGYAVAVFLQRMEAAVGYSLIDHFDMAVGVSTGSILSAGLCAGLSPGELASFYERTLPDIFKKRWWRGWFKSAKYDPDVLGEKIERVMPAQWRDLRKKCMAIAVQITPQIRTYHWKSWRDANPVKVKDVLLSSSAAPMYFPPHKIGDFVYVDGGVYNSNPVVDAITEAVRMGHALKDIKVLVVNPYGYFGGIENGEKVKSALQWAPRIVPAFMESSSGAGTYHAKKLIGSNVLEVAIGVRSAMDDASHEALEAMVPIGVNAWNVWGLHIEHLLGMTKP